MCAAGWGGGDCTIPVSVSEFCLDGVLDAAGVCCKGFIDSMSGQCCVGQDVEVDRSGRCCGQGQAVDACGQCGGKGVAVDAQGTCCEAALPPSGICCTSGHLDSCGVCDGDDQCGWV